MITFLILSQLFLNNAISSQVSSRDFKDVYRILNTTQLDCFSIASGYKCTTENFNQSICANHKEICPANWGCIDLNNGFLCRPYDFTNIAKQHQSLTTYHPTSKRKRDASQDCSEILCQNGALCKRGKCKCLRHFRGEYCDEKVNYCERNPCKHRAVCISRVGDVTCDCSERLTGKYCELNVENKMRVMKYPNFLYVPLQYAGYKYYYIFYANDMGVQPEAEIDFGDGTVRKRKYLIINVNQSSTTELKYFPVPFNMTSENLQVYAFTHIFRRPKIYTVKMRAWNRFQEVYNTEYEIQVIAARRCSLELAFHNAPNEKENAFRLFRESAVYILTATWSNCMQIELEYQWEIHKVKTFEDKLTPSNLYQIRNYRVDLQDSSLYIPPYCLDYGNFTVGLTITMVKPLKGITRKRHTWFKIMRKPMIAHIQGGEEVWASTESLFYLDASLSYDPNYSRERQPVVTFSWRCLPVSVLCKGYALLNETGPILVVPPHGVDEQKYIFEVWVHHGTNVTVTEYTGKASQTIHAIRKSVPFYSIICIRNCIGGFSNSLHVIVLRGICIFGSQEEDQSKRFWTVYANPAEDNGRGMRLDNTGFSKDNYYVMFYEQQFEEGVTFKIIFSGYTTADDMVTIGNISYAEFCIDTYPAPEVEHCSIYPLEGYAMLTAFTITCLETRPNETARHEVIQFPDLTDRAGSGVLVGYDRTGVIENVTLGPGLRKFDYITTLNIIQLYHTGLFQSLDVNVTVFPLIYYLKRPDEVIQRFVHIGTGLSSPLYTLLSGGNYLELVQQIISATNTFEYFLMSEDSWSVDHKFTDDTVEQIRRNFITYLHNVPLGNILSLKHLATALFKVIHLPSRNIRWDATIVSGLSILRKIIQNLEDRFNIYNENVLQNDMDDLGILFLDIASSILKISRTIEETNTALELEQADSFAVRTESQTDYSHVTDTLEIIERYMELYMTYKVPNERTSLITSSKLVVFMKKASPDSLTVKSLALAGRIAIGLTFDTIMYNQNVYFNFKAIVIDDYLPNWSRDRDTAGFSFPFTKINITNIADGSPVEADLEIDIRPAHILTNETISGYLPVRLFWQIEEKHIQVHRLIVPKGGKLLINFLPIQGNCKLKIVVKKGTRPRLEDFWNYGIAIPQRVIEKSRDKGLSVFVDDEAKEEKSFYFLGVLPHSDSLKELMKDIEEPILPDIFHYDDDSIEDYGATTAKYKNVDYRVMPKVQFLTYDKNSSDTDYNNRTLPYSFSVHSVRCIAWSESEENRRPYCKVKETTTFSRVSCECIGYNPVTAVFERVPAQYQRYTTLRYNIFYTDNPLIPFMIIFTLILFIGLFNWAAGEDRKDRKRRTVCFLVDNYPQCEYCYLVIVQTGRKIKAETTSNVTVELEGTQATSLPHVLRDWTRDVFKTGSQEWFVLKTMKSLGDIYALHIWTDYSGSKPSWYCSKIIVQDIQEQQVCFFIVEKWFDPISGDGTMSYTIYRAANEDIFSVGYQVKENIAREFDSGMHGWLSIFYKHPYSNYTRKQRVGVAYTHMVIIMLILILQNELPVADLPLSQIYPNGAFNWENRDIILPIKTVLLALPFHCLLVWLFRCIKPSSQWSESRLDRNLSRFNMSSSESEVYINVDVNGPIPQSSIQVSRRPKPIIKKVSFVSDFYEPEGDRKLRSKLSLEKLEEKAGKHKVVPLRSPTSKIETEDSRAMAPEISNTQMYGQEVVTQSYCFPPGCLFVAWIILILIAIPCVYCVVFYGVSYGWVLSLHYLFSFFLTIIFSMVFVEPIKLLVVSVYLFVYNRREFSIEDRSDLVATLNHEFTVAANMQSQITDKINKLRRNSMYMPLTVEQVSKLKRNRVVTFLTRVIIADFMLMILFVLLLLTMIYNIFDTHGYLHYKNVKVLFEKDEASRKSTHEDVYLQEDLVYYLENTVIANLHSSDSKDAKQLMPVRDEVNYLIGVIRLRQVRKSPYACQLAGKRVQRWASRCENVYDYEDYTQGWKRKKAGKHQRSYDNKKEAWTYKATVEHFREPILHYNETKYPAGCYMALLGRTRESSLEKLKYLSANKWFDHLTKVVFIDFVLYNPHVHYLTLVTLMAERMDQGVYYIHNTVEKIKMHPQELIAQLYLILFLLGVFLWLIVFIHRESKKYSLLKPKQIFSKKWNLLKKFLLVLGVINIIIYTRKKLFLNFYHEQIAMAAQDRYINFGDISVWDKLLTYLIGFMLFLIIIDLCNILQTFYRMNLAWAAISKSTEAACSFAVFIAFLVAAFTWTGYLIYGSRSYYFHTFSTAFFTVIGFLHRDFSVTEFGNITDIWNITFFYYVAAVMSLFFIFRWLIAAIVIYLYSTVKRNARFELYQSVLSNYTKKYFDTLDSSPNRKPLKLTVYLQKVEPRLQAMGYMFVHFYQRKRGRQEENHRLRAMNVITASVMRTKYQSKKKHYENLQKYQREEQAKALTRTIIITNAFKNKLEYLSAKVDILIRNERYKQMGVG